MTYKLMLVDLTNMCHIVPPLTMVLTYTLVVEQ